MKNNKAFTLAELLAVIAILLVVAVIITPKVMKEIKKSQQIAYNKQIEEITNAAKIYMSKKTNLLSNDIYVITFSELKNEGLLTTEKVLNPQTKEELTGCITVKYQNNKYEYEYTEDETECSQ